MSYAAKLKSRIRNDANFSRLGRGVTLGVKGTRAGAGKYFKDKLPVAQWIVAYQPRWLIADVNAGQSVALLLIPQALSYAVLSGVPIQQALLASWLPGIIHAFMGTSRDISTGPTFTSAVLTGKIVMELSTSGVPPVLTAAVLSLCVGLWSIAFGFLNLGFIFDFVSLPTALGYVTGIAIVVITLQLPMFLGIDGIPQDPNSVIPDTIRKIAETKPLTLAIGATSVLFLVGLQLIEKKWGSKSEILRIITNSRHIFVVGISTLVSYLVNKDLQIPMWANIGAFGATIESVQMPNMVLFENLFLSSSVLFATISLEHVSFARVYGHASNYVVSNSQEMVVLGITNVANSFFGGIPVGGGDMARICVSAASGAKSPLSGMFTSIVVIGAMYQLNDALAWLPQATVAAVIIVAVIDKMPLQSLILLYWRISFVDFVNFNIAMNITPLTSSLVGIGLSFAFMLIYTLCRIMFSRPAPITAHDLEEQYNTLLPPRWSASDRIPEGTQVIKLETDVTFLNSERIKRHIIDKVLTHQAGLPNRAIDKTNRPWNFRMDKHIAYLRRRAGVSAVDSFLPRICVVILDLSATSFIDAAAIQAFEEIRRDLRAYGGDSVEFRWVGLNPGVRRRFERAKWNMVAPFEARTVVEDDGEGEGEKEGDFVFEFLPNAILWKGNDTRDSAGEFSFDDTEMYMGKMF